MKYEILVLGPQLSGFGFVPLLACLKSHCLLGQDFILSSLCQSSLFYLTLFTLRLSLFQGHLGCWSFTLTPGTPDRRRHVWLSS